MTNKSFLVRTPVDEESYNKDKKCFIYSSWAFVSTKLLNPFFFYFKFFIFMNFIKKRNLISFYFICFCVCVIFFSIFIIVIFSEWAIRCIVVIVVVVENNEKNFLLIKLKLNIGHIANMLSIIWYWTNADRYWCVYNMIIIIIIHRFNGCCMWCGWF